MANGTTIDTDHTRAPAQAEGFSDSHEPHRAVAARKAAARRTLLLLAAVCLMPVAASYASFYLWPPQGQMNYGSLLTPQPLPGAELEGVAGQPPLARTELEGRWTLVYVGAGGCDRACEKALYLMRQARRAQGREMERVARVWLVTDGAAPPARLVEAHAGLRIARADDAWLGQLPQAASGRHVFLVDPLGNAMMRFPEGADPKGAIRDLQRLLKYSQLGRG